LFPHGDLFDYIKKKKFLDGEFLGWIC
jgi:hypothetical protein